ncbi:PD-(D/E)XK nuclease family protein [Alcaligenes endophyticus]|uniref:PD-(D/E)XK nuclease family protein n=1 Tax=Alcaligenes endophyticus TaxID=1929088 RepID=A0ABT8ENE4_9BURK|nr:PD-(D/E)XK nuclease family protein [Alcaligenes endophyticus]MCX5591504.1 PD-(D/E)XK nuclease family protein [Alcaligenes endophyticus]MDN4122615.1 PD-(D/E)XK nuclease family protein [Alcaligenes endophyticus]
MQEFEPLNLDDLLSFESNSTLVITVNNRYARRLLGQLSMRVERTQSSLTIPAIVPFGAWLRQISDQLCFVAGYEPAAHEVDNFTSHLLWQQAIRACEEDGYFLDIAQAARSAAEADRLQDEWKIRVLPPEHTADYEHFLQWRSAYRQQLQQLDLDDANTSIERVLTAIRHKAFALDFKRLVVLGFHEFSPRFTDLLEAIQAQGVQIYRLIVPEPIASHVYCHSAIDTHDEWHQAASWARQLLDADPDAKVAIVAPSLETQIPLVHRVMRKALSDQGQSVHAYNVAAARPLAEWPFARAALSWVKVLAVLATERHAEPSVLASALLQGLCAGGQAEAGGRALIDVIWRERQELSITAERFQQALYEHAPILAQAWEQAYALTVQAPRLQDSMAWAQHWRKALEILGFPGNVALDSAGFQTLEALQHALQQLAAQAPAWGAISVQYAQQLFSLKLRETPFQPQRAAQARLDVLGFLEAEGGRWDAVWVLGLSDAVLPAVVRPNPLLPAPAQRRMQAPRATPERELAWARLIMHSLLRSADTVWLSYPQSEGEQLLRPSPLIASYPRHHFEPSRATQAIPAVQVEWYHDEQGPALTSQERTAGGVAVIEAQARNPLWAFVRYRLHARQLPAYATLADMNSRGLFLHHLLELLCVALPDQQALQHALSQGRLPSILGQVTQEAAQAQLGDYGAVLQALEIERAQAILANYVELELHREPYSVAGIEQQHTWQYEALQLRLRLDRLDRLEDGSCVLIDYKTGSGDFRLKQEWLRPRPINLQLPFYAVVLQEQGQNVVAASLARLHARQVELVGMGVEGLVLTGLIDWPDGHSWGALLNSWRQAIHQLAHEFNIGVASNQSVNTDDLRYCDVLPFLRLHDEREDQDEATQ